eukprot:COSAG04_NODE_2019_length_4991_cov_8.639002_3_plen_346_part_00
MCLQGACVRVVELTDGMPSAVEAAPLTVLRNLPELCAGEGGRRTANEALQCSCGMRCAGWLTLARLAARRPQPEPEPEPEPEPAAEACYRHALSSLLPWPHIIAGAEHAASAAFAACERAGAAAVAELARLLPFPRGPQEEGGAAQGATPFRNADLWRWLYALSLEAAAACRDAPLCYSLACVAHAIAAGYGPGCEAEAASALHVMSRVARDGWPGAAAGIRQQRQLLGRAVCAWEALPRGADETAGETAGEPPAGLRLVGWGGDREPERHVAACAEAALGAALLADDLARVEWALARVASPWLASLYEARCSLDYAWFELEAERGVASTHAALFERVRRTCCEG